MVDRLTPEQRSSLMSRIRGKNTTPELTVRKRLFALGYRYRLHRKDLAGKPDLVFVSLRKVIFVHGCFWHGHDCRHGLKRPSSNIAYWAEKVLLNQARDARAIAELTAHGWTPLVIWECQVKSGAWELAARRFLEARATDG